MFAITNVEQVVSNPVAITVAVVPVEHRSSRRVLPPQVVNPITHIVKRYARNGHIRLPDSAGGRAFVRALLLKGIVATV